MTDKKAWGLEHNPERSRTDDYPTDPAWTRVLVRNIRYALEGKQIWEPAAGAGMMVDALEAEGLEVHGTDIEAGRFSEVDFLQWQVQYDGPIVTNPPYRLLDAFVAKALELTTEAVAMLLPVHALGGEKRYRDLWSAPPDLVIVVSNRMTVEGKHSQFNHCWAVWLPGDFTSTELRWELAK